MKKFFKPLVLVMLATSMAIVSCAPNRDEIDGIKNDIAALKDKVAANEVDVKAQIGTLQYLLQSYKDEVNPKLVALDAQLKKDYADLSAADAALDKAIKDAQTVLQAAIAKNADDIAANKKEIQAAIAEYKKLVANAIEGFELAMAKAKEDQALVDGAQNMAIDALSAQFKTFKEAVDEAISNLGIKVDELATAMVEMGDDINDLQQQVDDNLAASYAYTDALAVTVDAALGIMESRIIANEAAIKELNEKTIPEIEEAILALQTSIVGLEGNVAALDEKKLDKSVFEAFLKEHTEWKATIDNSIKSINGSIELLKIYDGIIGGQVEYLTELVKKLNGDETVEGSIQQQIKVAIAAVYEKITKDLNTLKTDIEGKIESLQTDVKSLKGSLDLANAEIDIIHGNLDVVKEAIEDIDDEIAAAQGDIKDLQAAKTKLENDLKALEAALESRMKAVEELTAGLKDQIDTINGDKETEGSIAYAVEQLRASIQTQIDELAGKVNKNAEDIAELQKQIGLLQQRIQSLVFVPQYTDLKFGIPFTLIGTDTYKAYNPDGGFAVVYKVAPAELAKPLAKAVNDAIAAGTTPVFTFDIESGLKTRAGDNDPKFIFVDASGDEKTGKMTFHLKHMNFEPKGGTLDQYAISLRADNDEYKVHVASEYVQAKLHKFGTITIKTDYIYKPNISTGEVDDASKIQTGVAQNLDIQYTDGATHTFVDGYELAAEDTESHKIRTISQWKTLGYEMPEVTVTATAGTSGTTNIIADLKGTSSTFAVKIMDGLNDNMKNTKNDIAKTNAYTFAFNYGAATPVNVLLNVNITKYDGAFHFKFPYTMTWTYGIDAAVDNHNKQQSSTASWNYYTRTGDADKANSQFVVAPCLTVGDEDYPLDGSNKVFGLVASDLFDNPANPQAFSDTTVPGDFTLLCPYTDDNTVSMEQFNSIAGERLGKTYEFTGSYNRDKYSTAKDVSKIVITTVDRKTEDIKITAQEKAVKLLGAEYKSDDKYDISSASFTDALMAAYINQGIFDGNTTPEHAFGTEFLPASIEYVGRTGLAEKFDVESKAGTAESGDETFVIKSNANFKSPVLHEVASNYEDKPWTLTVETYVGQKVIITWPIKAEPLHPYRFVTYGLDSQNAIQVPMVWVNGTDNITKAQTEVDVIKYNNANVKVKYTEGTTETTVEYGKFADADIKLVPRFSLVNATTDGIAVANSGTADLNCISNVTYYGQAVSVAIKSSLYVKSGNIEFLVPGSDQMYVGGTPVSSITVKQVNPIADTQEPIVTITNMPSTGLGDVSLTMKDILGNSLYANGDIQNKQTPYKEDVKAIFGSVKFSVYTVGGSSATTGWTLYGADSFGISDTPSEVQLMTNAVATGSYDVVIRARTLWKDYYYTVKVNVN